ncbi:MAG TPA: hypothetical protein VJ351_03800, partial [Streptosporangiaceae bacterium]|nr:hypothetical protein [Streptosporangiaceae bacterium]
SSGSAGGRRDADHRPRTRRDAGRRRRRLGGRGHRARRGRVRWDADRRRSWGRGHLGPAGRDDPAGREPDPYPEAGPGGRSPCRSRSS